MRTISAVVDIAATPQQVWAVLADLDAYQDWKRFIGTHQFALDGLGGRTRLTQCETFRGVLVPFTGSAITRTEPDFRAFNQAPKQRAERNKGVASS